MPARFAEVLGAATELVVSRRDGRWLALGADVVAFAADDDAGWSRLGAEGALFARWRAAGVPAPRVLDEDVARRVQVRERLHGLMGEAVEPLLFGGEPPEAVVRLSDEAPLSAFGARLAASYGELAARIHAAIPANDALATTLGPRTPLDLDAVLAAMRDAPLVEAATIDAVVRAMPWLRERPHATGVIHGDLHFHNMCLADDGSISGVFDVGDSGLDAAEHELHYAHSLGGRFAAAALRAYGRPLDVDAIRRAHVHTALGHLLWHGPGKPRHASIVRWISAIHRHGWLDR